MSQDMGLHSWMTGSSPEQTASPFKPYAVQISQPLALADPSLQCTAPFDKRSGVQSMARTDQSVVFSVPWPVRFIAERSAMTNDTRAQRPPRR